MLLKLIHRVTVSSGLLIGIVILLLQVIINVSPRWYSVTCTAETKSSLDTSNSIETRYTMHYGLWRVCCAEECTSCHSFPREHHDSYMLPDDWLTGTRVFAVISVVDVSLLVLSAFIASLKHSSPMCINTTIGLALAFTLFQLFMIVCGNPSRLRLRAKETGCELTVDNCFMLVFVSMFLAFLTAIFVSLSTAPKWHEKK